MFGACYNFNQNLDRVAIYWDKNPAINYPGIESLNHLLAYSHRWNNGYGNRVTPDGTDGEINWSLSNLKGINSAFRIWDYRNDAALALKININAPLLADCANMFRGHKWYSEQTALVDNLKFWFRKYPNTFSLANWFYGDRNTTSGNFDPALLSEIYQQWCLDVLQDDALTKKPGIQTRIPIHMGQSKYITDVVFVGGRTVQQVLDILQKNAAEGGQFEWVITDGGSAS
jgi:hypothetical protein